MGIFRPLKIVRILPTVWLGLLVLTVTSSPAHSKGPDLSAGLVGFEFTVSFVDSELRRTHMTENIDIYLPNKLAVMSAIFRRVQDACQSLNCRSVVQPDAKSVEATLDDGFKLLYHFDPKVIEINTSKLSYNSFKEKSTLIQKLVFDLLSKENLQPLKSLGGGHVNLDVITHFGSNLHGVLDFLEDLLIQDSVYGYAFRTPSRTMATPASLLTDAEYEILRQVFLKARIWADQPEEDARLNGLLKLKSEIQNAFAPGMIRDHQLLFAIRSDPLDPWNPRKFRMELRIPKPQENTREAQELVNFIHLRMGYLLEHPPSTRGLPEIKPLPPTGPKQIARMFTRLIEESGGDIRNHSSIVSRAVGNSIRKKECVVYLSDALELEHAN